MSRIKNIKKINIVKETLHNLEVQEDESYVANGIVVHNCKSYLQPIYKTLVKKKPEIDNAIAPPSIQKGKSVY